MDDRGRLFHANSRRGCLWLVMIWATLRALDAMIYFQTDVGDMRPVMLLLLNDIIWTTTLAIAIGYRQAWAKYGLVAVVALGVAIDVIRVAQISPDSSVSPTVLVLDGLGRAIIVLILLRSWDIRRLTSRVFE